MVRLFYIRCRCKIFSRNKLYLVQKFWTASGEVNNIKLLDWTNKSLNDAVLKAGAQANVATDIDVRVTAVTKLKTEIKRFRCSNN